MKKHHSEMPEILKYESAQTSYPESDKLIPLPVKFNLRKKHLVLLMGSNGSGKSTILNLIGGSLDIVKGFVSRCDSFQDIHSRFFQHEGLLKRSSALINIMMAGATENEGMAALKMFGLEDIADKRCGRLSGGERHLVQFCRVMTSKRRIWLLDEPTSGVDRSGIKLIVKSIDNHIRENGSVVCVTHDNSFMNHLEELLDKSALLNKVELKNL